MQGGGGLNGSVNPPLGAVAAGGNPALARGFAVVTTDTGHQGAVFDPPFMADQEAALNFAYVAIGRVAELAKAMNRPLLRERGEALVLLRLLHRRSRGDGDDPALPAVV